MTSQYYYPLSLNFRVLLIEGHESGWSANLTVDSMVKLVEA